MIISMLENGCKVGFFGLGISNLSLLSSLPLKNCRITLRDEGIIDDKLIPSHISFHRKYSGGSCFDNIDEDIIIFSPSVRRERAELLAAKERGVIFTSDAQLFFEMNNAPTLAVTGSDGKSTTATLIHLLLTKSGKKSKLIGNIGQPMTESICPDAEYYVCEMSSFMLRYFKPRTHSACITNITPNHLDWHRDFNEYTECKRNLIDGANRAVISSEFADYIDANAIVSLDLGYKKLLNKYGDKLYITAENNRICRNGLPVLCINDLGRCEPHNIQNMMMAIAMTDGIIDDESIRSAASNFSGLRHRCEDIGIISGVRCIDSSIDSTPQRTSTTLKSLGREIVIILGGRGKGLDYKDLLPEAKKWVKRAIICGDNANEIYDSLSREIKSDIVEDFDEAVRCGFEYARQVGILLLSPASTSYDKFKNYAERGEKFKEILQNILNFENNSLQNIEETSK